MDSHNEAAEALPAAAAVLPADEADGIAADQHDVELEIEAAGHGGFDAAEEAENPNNFELDAAAPPAEVPELDIAGGGAAAAAEGVPVAAEVAEELVAAAAAGVEEGEISLGDLIGMTKSGLYTSHPSWAIPCRIIVQQLLEDAVSPDPVVAFRGAGALIIFPGLIEQSRNGRGEVLSPINLIRCIEAHPDRASEIIRWARLWAMDRRARAREWAEVNSESIRRRVEGYIKDGRLSLASKTLQILSNLRRGVAPAAPMSPEHMAAKVAELHPPADHRDVLPEETEDPAIDLSLNVSAETIRDKFYTLKLDSGAGGSGWTNKFLRFLGEDRDFNLPTHMQGVIVPSGLHRAFAGLANKIFRGEVRGEARELMVTARLIMVPKEAGGYRPITVQCAIQRLFGSVANDAARRILGDFLRPLQMGGGYKSGPDILVRELDECYAAGDVIIQCDAANAFNEARRGNMYDRVKEKVPGLARFFRFQYGTDSPLRNNQGVVIARSATGVAQGHPCSPLFFELGIQKALVELTALVVQAEAEYDQGSVIKVARKGAVRAYEDDLFLHGEAEVMFIVAPHIAALCATHGIRIKVDKSKITGTNTDIMQVPEDFVIESEGLIALGVPIGTPDYCTNSVRAKLLAMEPPTEALQFLRPRSQYQLLTKCFSVQPAYLLRIISDLTTVAQDVLHFDNAIIDAVAATFKLVVTPELKTRINLPRKLGGLGIPKHYGMASDISQSTSRLVYINFVRTFNPASVAFTQQQYNLKAIRMGEREGLEIYTEISEEDRAGMDHLSCKGILKAGKNRADIWTSTQLHSGMAMREESESRAAWFLSCTNGGTAFMDSTMGIAYERYFSDGDFVCAARMKLGVGPAEEIPVPLRVCACGQSFAPDSDPFHAISCRLNSHHRTFCHTDVVRLLYDLLKTRYPLSVIQKEKEVGTTAPMDGQVHGIRADIVASIGAVTYVIDVSTIDPGNLSSLALNPSSAVQQDAASRSREAIKRRHYRKVVTPAPLSEASVIPFVLETTGRLGPSAIAFLHTICPTQTFLRTKFLNTCVMILARSNGKLLQATRERFRQYL